MKVQVQDNMNIQMKYSKIIAQFGSNKKFSLLIFRFGSSRRISRENSKDVKPGPGNYDPENLNTSQGYSFGLDRKHKRNKSEIPGPGQYHIPCSIVDVPKYLATNGNFNKEFRYI